MSRAVNLKRVAEIMVIGAPQIVAPEIASSLAKEIRAQGYEARVLEYGMQFTVTKGLRVDGVAMELRRERLAAEGWE